jgi:DNA-binding XRE family transcriptional regulator
MARPRKRVDRAANESGVDRAEREEAIAEQYRRRPSLRALYDSGQIDREAYERAESLRAAGPPTRPARTLIAALRAERERQGLSLADIAERAGVDRAAVHKLEIGVNRNPTLATLNRYAEALGVRIEWSLKAAGAGGDAVLAEHPN